MADTPQTVINGRDGTADFTIATVSYRCILSEIEIEALAEMLVADVFCNEGTADQEPGREQLRFRLAGLLGKDTPASGPLIPLPQNVAIVATYSVGCTIGFNANFTRGVARRTVNANSALIAEGLSKKTFSVTWDKTPGP
jgi:hypothetical protein